MTDFNVARAHIRNIAPVDRRNRMRTSTTSMPHKMSLAMSTAVRLNVVDLTVASLVFADFDILSKDDTEMRDPTLFQESRK